MSNKKLIMYNFEILNLKKKCFDTLKQFFLEVIYI